ncbi:uncharacterized protein LOC117640418 [Thrips palmi]|uniref:Uncharacterized protein LOC117640418 n=1 Tax=Thrips palmi TaxID=161013 RepID=A0A6P8Y851_THRPL|nr:uncharacterized protein LOC117640418 [Thrips palmi]
MVRGLQGDWKMPVAYFAVNGTSPSDMLASLIKEVIRELRKLGLQVVASVSDQGATNQGAINELRSQCEEGKLDPVYKVDDERVVHLYDIPHVMKSMRNNLLSSDLEDELQQIVRWSYIIEFFKLDEGMCKTSKLQYSHLCPMGRNKMRVDLAAQTFSETTGCGMKTFHMLTQGTKLVGAEPTIEFILTMDQLFDSMNGPGRKDAPKAKRQNVTEDSFHHAFWREMIPKIEKWVFIRKSSGVRHIPPCLKGLIDNLRGLEWIWKVVKKLGFTSLKLRNLNQDPLENYFGQIRQSCGSNSDPTLAQFVGAMKVCLVQQITSGRNQNCEDDGASFLADFGALINEWSVPTTRAEVTPTLIRGCRPEEINNTLVNKLTRQAPSLNCATMCTKILAATERCKNCYRFLSSNEDSTDFTLQLMLEKTSGLDKPSPYFTNFYLTAQKIVAQKWNEIGWKQNLVKNIKYLLSEETSLLEWVDCEIHSDLVQELLLHLSATRIVQLKCSAFNTSIKEQKVRRTRQAEMSKKSQNVAEDFGIEAIDPRDFSILTGLPGIDGNVLKKLQSHNPLLTSKQNLDNALHHEENGESELVQQNEQLDDPSIPIADASTETASEIVLSTFGDEFSLLDAFEAVATPSDLSPNPVSEPSTSSILHPPSTSSKPPSSSHAPVPSSLKMLQDQANTSNNEIDRLEETVRQGKAQKLTLPQLKAVLKARGVKGYSRLNKEGLVKLVNKC